MGTVGMLWIIPKLVHKDGKTEFSENIPRET
jgi:hypothetical protein